MLAWAINTKSISTKKKHFFLLYISLFPLFILYNNNNNNNKNSGRSNAKLLIEMKRYDSSDEENINAFLP
jgi:hypothetical protein